ncbi:hypothetical protein D3C74_434700 [compost metagenome]
MGKTDPRTVPHTICYTVILKRNQQTIHRAVMKNGIVEQDRNKHQIDKAIANEIFFDEAFFAFIRYSGYLHRVSV